MDVRASAAFFVLVSSFANVSAAQRVARVRPAPPLTNVAESLAFPGNLPVSGDTPLTPLAAFAGHVGLFVKVLPFEGDDVTSGNFVVSGLPAGAQILRAWVHVTSFDDTAGNAVTLDFDGTILGPKQADVVDPGGAGSHLFCSLYRFDVTPLVSGNGTYSHLATGRTNAYADALIVVYEDASLLLRTIVLNDGAESLANAVTTTTFTDVPAGAGELLLYTAADDPFGSSEAVRLNGVTVAGPGDVFNRNLGVAASLVKIPVTAQAGDNVLDVVTGADWFGLHLAALTVNTVTSVVIDFETEDDFATALVNGQDVQSGAEFGNLVDIDGFPVSGLRAAIFDSTPGGPNDPSQDLDLLVDLGNVLILQQQPAQSVPGIYDRPNDDANGGHFEIAFHAPVAPLSVDLVDIDPGLDFASVSLNDAAGRRRTFTAPAGWTEDLVADGAPAFRTLDLTELGTQPGFIASATAVEDAGFDQTQVLSMSITLGGSGAIDNLAFLPGGVPRTIDFEDLGLAPGTQLDPAPFVPIASGGFLFEPTVNNPFHDVHAGNQVGLPWMWDGTTVLAGHAEILMRRADGGAFSLESFSFSGWPVHNEAPTMTVVSDTTTATFFPDLLCDGAGGVEDFQEFALPAGFTNVTSVLFVHVGPNTAQGTFGLDDLHVRTAELLVVPFTAGHTPSRALPRVGPGGDPCLPPRF